jgi:hypothetical protein
VFLDERNSFDAVLPLPDDVNFRKAFEQVRKLIARRFLVINDDGIDGHGQDVSSFSGMMSFERHAEEKR